MRRLPSGGGGIDRSVSIPFRWNDRSLSGYRGDTLASALLANDIRIVGQSVTFGRPRGLISAGLEEANGFAQLGSGAASEPLARITGVELFPDLAAQSRSTKGLLPTAADSTRFEKRHGHCDILVVGGGPAGLAAARAAASGGARVMIASRGPTLGGGSRWEDGPIDGRPPAAWIAEVERELEARSEVRILRRTTAQIALDQNGMILVERVAEHLPASERGGLPERILWQVRARRIILAAGALERPIVFQDNDRPGVMLAGAARRFLRQFGLAPERAVVFTTGDAGYRAALDFATAGVPVVVVDPRANPIGPNADQARAAGVTIHADSVVRGTEGGREGVLTGALVGGRSGGTAFRLECDLLALSGGYDPTLDLHHQRRGPVRWDDPSATYLPAGTLPGQAVIGAAAGDFSLGGALAAGDRAGREAAALVDQPALDRPPPIGPTATVESMAPLWYVPAPDGDESRSFVDLHRDVTVAGVQRGLGAGIRHAEHLKRYTLIGTGIEQGRSAKILAAAVAATLLERPSGQWGTSSARPPVEPLGFLTVAGRARGPLYEPIRTTPIHPAHLALGAVFENVGQWKRPNYYPRPGESMAAAVARECRAVRSGVAMMDASTLGKIDVQGPDAARFLDRLYLNRISALKVGRARYAAMCRLDGVLFDDGVVMRVGPNRFFVTTSTSHAAPVMEWMEEWLQTEWPDLRVWITSITEQWATLAIVGPHSRSVLQSVTTEIDLGKGALPFMAVGRGRVAGVEAQIARVSFSGELAFEVSVPGTASLGIWEALMTAGAPQGITPYGLEALGVLRAEKGYLIVGQDTDASTTPIDAGLGWMISADKDFLGRRSLARADIRRPDRERLVGFLPDDGELWIPEGAQLVADPTEKLPMTMIGHVTSSYRSEALGRTFGLAMVRGGAERIGQRLYAPLLDRTVAVTLVDPVFYDKEGVRRDG